MSKITTYVLDQIHGIPASGKVQIADAVTNSDSRNISLLKNDYKLQKNMYQLMFDTSTYFEKYDLRQLYRIIPISFYADDLNASYHVSCC